MNFSKRMAQCIWEKVCHQLRLFFLMLVLFGSDHLMPSPSLLFVKQTQAEKITLKINRLCMKAALIKSLPIMQTVGMHLDLLHRLPTSGFLLRRKIKCTTVKCKALRRRILKFCLRQLKLRLTHQTVLLVTCKVLDQHSQYQHEGSMMPNQVEATAKILLVKTMSVKYTTSICLLAKSI